MKFLNFKPSFYFFLPEECVRVWRIIAIGKPRVSNIFLIRAEIELSKNEEKFSSSVLHLADSDSTPEYIPSSGFAHASFINLLKQKWINCLKRDY